MAIEDHLSTNHGTTLHSIHRCGWAQRKGHRLALSVQAALIDKAHRLYLSLPEDHQPAALHIYRGGMLGCPWFECSSTVCIPSPSPSSQPS